MLFTPLDLVLPPKTFDCQPSYRRFINSTVINSTFGNETGIQVRGASLLTSKDLRVRLNNGTMLRVAPSYNYSKEYGRSVFTDVSQLHRLG